MVEIKSEVKIKFREKFNNTNYTRKLFVKLLNEQCEIKKRCVSRDRKYDQ